MKAYAESDIAGALTKVGITPGSLTMMHSSLLALGHFNSPATPDMAAAIRDAILRHLGPAGTLVVPAFNFGFCDGAPFNRHTTPSEGMGQLSESVRLLPASSRSPHPLQSVAAIGPLAQTICEPDTSSAYDPAGPFGIINRLDGQLLLAGAGFQAASFIHYVEEQCAVPYRYWKEFTGAWTDREGTEIRTYRMYVRNRALKLPFDSSPIERALQSRGLVSACRLGAGWIKSCRFQDLLEITTQALAGNAWCLVGGAPVAAAVP